MASNHKIIEEACIAIGNGDLSAAKSVIATNYPFSPPSETTRKTNRKYSKREKIKIFMRDGFIDRYSGEKLVFPPVLHLLSNRLPAEFPYHVNWKMSDCHIGYWQLFPTIDHIIPVSRGGADEPANWVCTSQLRNSKKSSLLLEEIGWKLHKPGNPNEWDGLMKWFKVYASENPTVLEDKYILSWHKAADGVGT